MKPIGVIFPHQLFIDHELLVKCSKIYLIEERLFFKQYNFHKVKLAFHRASMRAYAKKLIDRKIDLEYVECSSHLSDIRSLIRFIGNKKEIQLHIINPTDNWLEKRIQETTSELGIELHEYENPLFLNSRSELGNFFRNEKKSFFHTTFYKQQRRKRKILLDAQGNPDGGKWSFDAENRKKYPKDSKPPFIQFPSSNQYWQEAIQYVQKHFPNNIGDLSENPIFPFTHDQTASWFEQFLSKRFHRFGDYEDAILSNELFLHHSVLSPMVNVGLILPNDILDKTLSFSKTNKIPLNSIEGFVRQIIGWREFIRGMYECKGTFSRTSNFWGFKRAIPKCFYDGSTGIIPLDETIRKVLKTGYCHHIERLMILGNFMLLCEFHPNEVYRWFMELFIDAYDWVMVPNVYGMSQFADGGTFATKPYISGSNYILKMSDYKKGDWSNTWDGLFWRFLHAHRKFFKQNPRLSMLIGTFDKMNVDKQNQHMSHANDFLEKLDNIA